MEKNKKIYFFQLFLVCILCFLGWTWHKPSCDHWLGTGQVLQVWTELRSWHGKRGLLPSRGATKKVTAKPAIRCLGYGKDHCWISGPSPAVHTHRLSSEDPRGPGDSSLLQSSLSNGGAKPISKINNGWSHWRITTGRGLRSDHLSKSSKR